MWVASTHSRAGLIKLEKQGWAFSWILHGPQSPRPHGDGIPVRPHKVSYKVSYIPVTQNLLFEIVLSDETAACHSFRLFEASCDAAVCYCQNTTVHSVNGK